MLLSNIFTYFNLARVFDEFALSNIILKCLQKKVQTSKIIFKSVENNHDLCF